MYKFGYINIAMLICLLSSPVHSKGLRYGGSVGMLSIDSVEYAEGSSGEEDILRYGFVHTRPIDENNNRWRWWFGFNYLEDSVEAPINGVYEEVTNYEFRLVPQFALADWSVFTPYIGAGFSAGYTQYGNRWEVDDEGYKYGLQLDDISQFEVGLIATAGSVIKIGSNPNAHLQIIPQISYILPVYNNGLGGVEFSIALLF